MEGSKKSVTDRRTDGQTDGQGRVKGKTSNSYKKRYIEFLERTAIKKKENKSRLGSYTVLFQTDFCSHRHLFFTNQNDVNHHSIHLLYNIWHSHLTSCSHNYVSISQQLYFAFGDWIIIEGYIALLQTNLYSDPDCWRCGNSLMIRPA